MADDQPLRCTIRLVPVAAYCLLAMHLRRAVSVGSAEYIDMIWHIVLLHDSACGSSLPARDYDGVVAFSGSVSCRFNERQATPVAQCILSTSAPQNVTQETPVKITGYRALLALRIQPEAVQVVVSASHEHPLVCKHRAGEQLARQLGMQQ